MVNQFKNMLIGLFVVVGVGLIVGLILFIEPSVGDGKEIVHVRFSNLQGISVGTRVTLAGKTVGDVASIQVVPNAREKTVGPHGQVYLYLVTLRIDSSVTLYTTDDFTIGTSGLMGEKYILIIPKELPPNVKPQRITSTDIIYADSSDLLESALNELSNVSDKIEETLDAVVNWIHNYGDSLGSAIQSFDTAVKEVGIAVKKFNDLDIMTDIKKTIVSFNNTIDHIDEIILDLQQRGTFIHLASTIANIDSITTDIASGKGTLGKLVTDDNLYLQINALFSKTNTLLSDINNYGLMFHLNKEWKRKRIQQAQLSSSIKNPNDFQAYLDREMGEIQVAVSRLDTANARLHEMNDRNQLSDCRYKKNLRELMQRLDTLQETIELYNQELSERMKESCCP